MGLPFPFYQVAGSPRKLIVNPDFLSHGPMPEAVSLRTLEAELCQTVSALGL